ncbi:thioredoxin domain [Arthrobacter phage DrSierra]|uniref:NrdH-like glutaredoxin n=1 Tax=Arthrobacter phage DrSierra TaxID=2704034 RepID=A0A6G6XL66_9CAUD|nr:thioredoxin domain [Arthrobacter phage DrSierra]QIG58510.1 NrdH-like glutaredoxin [Arthrobacter phage DrSierra]
MEPVAEIDFEITLYSRDHCQPCKATVRKFKKHGIPFRELNTSHNAEAREFLINAGFTEAPVVICTDGREWTGFRPDIIEAIAKEGGTL